MAYFRQHCLAYFWVFPAIELLQGGLGASFLYPARQGARKCARSPAIPSHDKIEMTKGTLRYVDFMAAENAAVRLQLSRMGAMTLACF